MNVVAVEQIQLTELLSKVWHNVVTVVNKLLETHQKYGYVKFQEEMNPSLPEVIEGFRHVDSALTSLMDSSSLEYDEYRAAINSKQCILKMRLLAAALERDQQADYERIISELETQSKF